MTSAPYISSLANHPVNYGLLSASSAQKNPYVEVSESIYILARACIIAYLIMMVMFAFGSKDAAPYTILRLFSYGTLVVVSTIPLWLRTKQMGLFHPLYILSGLHFAQAVLPSISLAAVGVTQHPALPGKSGSQIAVLHLMVIWVHVLSWSCLFIGFYTARGSKWQFLRFSKRHDLVKLGALVGLIVGTVCLYLLFDLSGGFWDHLKNINVGIRAKVWVKDPQYVGIYSNLVRLTVLAPGLWILIGKKPFSNPVFWVLVLYAIASSFMVNGRRSTILMIVVILSACWILRRGSLAIGRMVIIGFLLFMMVGLVGEFRRSNWGKQRDVRFDTVLSQDIRSTMEKSITEINARRGGSALFPIIARVPSNVPFRYHSIYFSYLYRFVPRIIWRDKPKGGIGIECADIFYGQPDSGGIPPAAIGEAYWSFGIVGVVIVFFIWGMIVKSLGTFFVRFRDHALANVLYLATITKLGPSETNFRAWLYLIGPVIFLMFCIGAIRFNAGRN